MGHSVTIGGERLGSGKRMKAYLHNYERSTHDLSYVWRSTMACGTLVPFMSQVALPGDTFDIGLNVDILTHPTIGPLFGTYKIQLDVFQVPIRLYQGKLHMNMLGIGMDMSKVALPQLRLVGSKIDQTQPLDNQQVNPSSILAYLGIRGTGMNVLGRGSFTPRDFNAVPLLGYWDIYKNYYANKQEEKGAVIHFDTTPYTPTITGVTMANFYNATTGSGAAFSLPLTKPGTITWNRMIPNDYSQIKIQASNMSAQFNPKNQLLWVADGNPADPNTKPKPIPMTDLMQNWELDAGAQLYVGTIPNYDTWNQVWVQNVAYTTYAPTLPDQKDTEPQIKMFPLENIDTMRKNLLAHLIDAPYVIMSTTPLEPYTLPLEYKVQADAVTYEHSIKYSQEGLAIKTYQSDLFNNWISTEWIDGPDGISAITAVDVSGGTLQIDELNMSKKIYDMLNRIAISGGSYDDWLDAVYTHERQRSAENPMYLGGLIRNLVFQEVISNAATPDAPLGTLAGRGKVGSKDKGGKIIAKIDEPSYLIGIISLTPNVDYSQGNQWDVNLKSLNDLHKPALDEIGFQDLVTDQMAWFDTQVDAGPDPDVVTFKSAGKQPAWVNYMTNVNKVYGNFADQTQQMFMVLNRRYEPTYGTTSTSIKDLTTYIDPTKFNHIFADTRRDAQNFWAQIGVNIEARRKMSAKVMPNL